MIIAILIAILVPVTGSIRRQADTVACLNILRQIGVATATYVAEHNNSLPGPVPNMNGLRPYYHDLAKNKLLYQYLMPYLGLSNQPNPTPLPDGLVCPAWRRRYPEWKTNQNYLNYVSYWLNQDATLNSARIFSDTKTTLPPAKLVALVAAPTLKTMTFGGSMLDGKVQCIPLSEVIYIFDGTYDGREVNDPVHGAKRNYLFLDFHAESRQVTKGSFP